METTSPRNSQLKLIEADERWGGHHSCPGVFLSNLNAYAERLVQTIKESCLERLILFGESAVARYGKRLLNSSCITIASATTKDWPIH